MSEALDDLIREARAELAAYIDVDWPENARDAYPPIMAKWRRDMKLCWRIDATLAAYDAAKGEAGGEFLARLGMDAAKWAAEFRMTAVRLGYSDMDEGWLIGWFANAIESTRSYEVAALIAATARAERAEARAERLRAALNEIDNAPEPQHCCPELRHARDVAKLAIAADTPTKETDHE